MSASIAALPAGDAGGEGVVHGRDGSWGGGRLCRAMSASIAALAAGDAVARGGEVAAS